MTPVRLEPAAPRSRVKHSTTESLRYLERKATGPINTSCNSIRFKWVNHDEGHKLIELVITRVLVCQR